uniref:Uncharacterized protein n=1 Tax=Euplotes crassus TaxID=5936 RepID=A0A7S3K6V8_EUPCR|mmetsp:Transcript_11988/g.11993  ORF Transcript_11988/g.11993 Transcript_11988/m.11993 type:complete len:275 (+) Transcript_11988:55-879(+)
MERIKGAGSCSIYSLYCMKFLERKTLINKLVKLKRSMCLTRKILRFGLPMFLIQQTKSRFIAACTDDDPRNDILTESRRNASQSASPTKPPSRNGGLQEEEKTLEDHDKEQIRKKVERFIKGGATGGAVGSHRRLVLTRSLADFCLILFSIFDFPLLRPIYGIRTMKYFFWFCQCVIVIIYQLIELYYVMRDIKFLKEYLFNHECDNDVKTRIIDRLKHLKRDYILRICSLVRHSIDVPMVLRFMGFYFIPNWLASLLGTISSAISVYTLVKIE